METNWIQLKNAVKGENYEERYAALVTIKDSIIGSNKQKSLLISHELVPDIIQVCCEDNTTNKIEALIIIGSLAKGTKTHVKILVETYNIISILKKELTIENNNMVCVEICLSALCSISEHDYVTAEQFFGDDVSISHFLALTSFMGNSLKSQIYITTILCSLCQSKKDQLSFLNAGIIPILTRIISMENEPVQIPALRCLCCMCFANRSVSDIICVTSFQGKSLTDILNCLMSRSFSPNIQLGAARCMTYIYRSGTLPSTDLRILHRTLPCLVRLCSEDYRQEIRASAAETLAILIEVDAKLQQIAAICNHLLKSLFQLIKINEPHVKQAALKCLAALGANDETIRKKIIDINSLVDGILQSLNDWESQVRIASIRCLHSLSRSVQQLRTTFQDHSIWEPLIFIMNNEASTDFLIAVTATICNLLLEFSPSKTPLIGSGIIEKLCQFTEHEHPSLRLNSIWALMNLTYQSDDSTKTNVINTIGIRRILDCLNDSNPLIVLKSLGLLRNILSEAHQIDPIMSMHAKEINDSLYVILDSATSAGIKEQALCVIGGVAAESHQKDYIINDERLLKLIGELLFHPDKRIQAGSLYVISSIVHRKDIWSDKSSLRLTNLNVLRNVQELNKTTENVQISNDYISRTLKQIVVKCKSMYPDITN
ncbi:armadillo repeat-containing protein 8-like [Glossina fuscipes]|uniref:Armadillo repeat-containing protein 8 n=2 Tax=Nemorhina TaxID=44051 RepID=A0A8U0W4V5_9MUSC|nr:armadillo repeat-containing protein 8-like [Glossina fuscipes]